MKRSVIGFLVGAAFILLCTLSFLAHWCMASLPVPERAASRISVGMSQREVRDILGAPTNISQTAEHESWVYSHRLKWNFFSVRFHHGTVTEAEWD